jgi:CoA:oxalate CoA-transferase
MNDDHKGALSSLRVLDFTQFLSGPFCTMVLADLGADVTKIEGPEGDMTRKLPPHFVGDDSAYYLHTNRNKRSLVIDLKQNAGRELAIQLAGASDVVVENFRPGVMDKLGLSYEVLSKENPGLIWCSISGFGQTGPYRDRPAYDMVVQALSGAMSMTGERGGNAVRLGIPMGDIGAGLYAAIGILAAVEERRTSGRGQRIDISMLDAMVSFLSYQSAYSLISGESPGKQGSGHDSIPTYRTFVAGDGVEVVVTANTERMWRGLCTALGLEELVADPRFALNANRWENRRELDALLEAAFLQAPAAVLVERMLVQGVPVATVNDVVQAVADPQIESRDMIVRMTADDGRTLRLVGNPVKLERGARSLHAFPPALGEHTLAVIGELLSMNHEETAALAQAGAIRAAS